MSETALLASVSSGLAVVVLLSIPANSKTFAQLHNREPKSEHYEDEDGKSTPEAVKAYSAKFPKTFTLLFAVAGLGVSIALAVLSILHLAADKDLFLENWLSVGAWVSHLSRYHMGSC